MRTIDDEESITRAKEQIDRAKHAANALDNPLISEYFIVSRAAMFERISKTKPNEVDVREQIYLEMMQLDRFQSNFHKAITSGKEAQSWLARLASKTSNLMKR